MLIWFHPVSVREWGRWNITKRKTQGRTGGAIWVTEPRHHLTITLQYTQRHRAPLCPCLRESCIVNTVTCQSGPFSPVKQILPFFPLFSNWVQLHLPAFAQEPASCRNCFPYKETQSQPGSLRTSSKLSPHKTRPRGLLLEWHKSWCLKTHSSAAGRKDLARDVPCGTCLHSQNSSRPDSECQVTPECGVLSTKPHLLLDVLPTCLHVINCPLRKTWEIRKKADCVKIFLSITITHGVLSSYVSSNVMTFLTAWSRWSQSSLFTILWSNCTFLGHALSSRPRSEKMTTPRNQTCIRCTEHTSLVRASLVAS